jgi:glucoamylase
VNRKDLEVWTPHRRARSVTAGSTLRVQTSAGFRLRWSADEWQTSNDTDAASVAISSHFVDIPVSKEQRSPIRFTFLWTENSRWQENDYEVAVSSNGRTSEL